MKNSTAKINENIISITPETQEIERLITYILKELTKANPETPLPKKVTALIQTTGRRPACMGHYGQELWESRSGEKHSEIQISAEYLNRTPLEIAGTVTHETVRLFAHMIGVKDCNKANRHNKEFQRIAESIGLICEEPAKTYIDDQGKKIQDNKGYARTSVGQALAKKLENTFKFKANAFNKFRITPESKTKKRQSLAKWTCGCKIVRVSPGIDINYNCDDCGNDVAKVD